MMVNFKVLEVEREILNLANEYTRQLDNLKAEKEVALRLEPEMLLADELHKRFCHHNHTDRCSYLYGNWDNPTAERREWLNKAIRLMSHTQLRGTSVEIFLELVYLVK